MIATRHALALSLLTAGCGSSTPPAETPAPKETSSEDSASHGPGISVESEVGALNEDKVRSTFEGLNGALTRCFTSGTQRVPYLAGEVRFTVRVKSDGKARVAFTKDSTLGDRATEECMVKVLKSASWPKPVGGNEGVAESSFSFDPPGDERPPVAWSPDQLGAPFKGARAALAHCRAGAGSAQIKATLYVETDGKPKSIGVSTSDERGESAAQCVVDTLQNITFPSPGSYASKVTVTIE